MLGTKTHQLKCENITVGVFLEKAYFWWIFRISTSQLVDFYLERSMSDWTPTGLFPDSGPLTNYNKICELYHPFSVGILVEENFVYQPSPFRSSNPTISVVRSTSYHVICRRTMVTGSVRKLLKNPVLYSMILGNNIFNPECIRL